MKLKKIPIAILIFLCCTYLAGWVHANEDTQYWKTLFPQYEYVQLGDIDTHVQVVGEGPPLVLVHGIGWGFDMFSALIPELAKSYRVYTFDLLGAGYSAKPKDADYSVRAQYRHLLDFVTYYGLKNFAVWGHSMGGAAAILIAHEHPEMVNCLILSDIWYEQHKLPNPVLKLLTWPGLGKFGEWFPTKWGIRNVLRNIYADPDRFATKAKINRLYDILHRPGGSAAFRATLRSVRTEEAPQFKKRMASLTMPVLLIWGEEDRWFPLEQGEELHKLIPHSEFQTLPNVGHMPIEENPEAMIRLSRDFLTRCSDHR